MRDCTSIEPQWLPEIAPHYYEYKTNQAKHYDMLNLDEPV